MVTAITGRGFQVTAYIRRPPFQSARVAYSWTNQNGPSVFFTGSSGKVSGDGWSQLQGERKYRSEFMCNPLSGVMKVTICSRFDSPKRGSVHCNSI